MTQVENRTTSLAQQLENTGFAKTSIVTAVAELVWSWLGAQHIDGKLLKQLQTTNDAAGRLIESGSWRNDKKDPRSNDDEFKKTA